LLAKRVATGVVLGVTVTIVLLALPTPYVALCFGLLWLGASWEWAGLAGLNDGLRWVYAILVAGLLAVVWSFGLYLGSALFVGSAIFWIVALIAILNYPLRLPAPIVFAAGILALVPAWTALIALHASEQQGPLLALGALGIVWGADVGAFFAGRALGHRRLAPSVSPGKTWEGVGGGLLAALVVAMLVSALLPTVFSALVPWLLITGVAALISVVGDLTVSMLKRARGLKDTGRLLPGHGGILDRIDGVTAALPILTLGLKLAGSLD
jgi:phosphatidate cytidylyltransferase